MANTETSRAVRTHGTANFNFTGKQRIQRSQADFVVRRDEGTAYLQGTVDLTGLHLPASARLIVEARSRTFYERVDWGTVEEPASEATISSKERRLNFRLLVLAESPGDGKILAECARIAAVDADERSSDEEALLPLRFRDLEERLWEIEWSQEGRPWLVVNNVLPGADGLKADAFFQAAVYPAAAEQILYTALTISDPWSGSDWRSLWLDWGAQVSGTSPPDEDERDDFILARRWVLDVIAKFCRQHRLTTALRSAREEH